MVDKDKDSENLDFGVDNQPENYSPQNLRDLLRKIKTKGVFATALVFREKVARILEAGNFVLIDNVNLLEHDDAIAIIKIDENRYKIYIGKVNINKRGKWGGTIYFEDNEGEEKFILNKAFMSSCIVFRSSNIAKEIADNLDDDYKSGEF